MGLIAEYTIQSSVLPKILERTPEMRFRNPAVYPKSDGTAKALVWVWGDDFNEFESGLDSHQMIGEYTQLDQIDDRRLYSISHAPGEKEQLPYSAAFDNNVIVYEAKGSYEGIKLRAEFPDRESIQKYRNQCENRGIPFRLHKLNEKGGYTSGIQSPLNVTERQKEILISALKMGYFNIPRQTTLEAIAQEFNISTQAISTRLRRGEHNLVRGVYDE